MATVVRRLAGVLALLGQLALPATVGATSHRERGVGRDQVAQRHTEALAALSASSEAVVAQLRFAREETEALLPWGPFAPLAGAFDLADGYFHENLGLDLGAAYTALYQGATRDPRPSGAGKFDLFGVWILLDRGDDSLGFLGFEASSWQVYTPTSPANLGGAIGSLWPTADDFSRLSFSLTQLYWEQQLPGGKLAYRIGKLDQDDVFDNYRFKGVDFYFVNQAFSTNPSIALPGRGLGALAAYDLGDGGYVVAGVGDARARDSASGFSTLFEHGSVFTAGEIGWAGDVAGWGAGEAHVTVWNSPTIPGQQAGWGIATTAEQAIGGNVVPFVRYSYGGGTATGIRQLATVGLGIDGFPPRADDVAGIAFAWGKPTDPTARDQISGEVFYRVQLTPLLQVTPGYQVLIDPATDSTRDLVGIAQVRARVVF